MKSLKSILFISASVLVLSSCTDNLLDREPLNIISDSQVYTDKTLADAKLTQAYTQMCVMINECPRLNNPKNGYWETTSDDWNGPFIINEIADEGVSNWIKGQSSTVKGSGISNSGGILEWWEDAYEVNRILNEFMEKMGNSSFADAYKKERIAEARFLRAFNYFYMVKRYGGVPLVLKAQMPTDSESELYVSRNTEKEVYDFILSEMDKIVTDLPARANTELGRPSRGAAMALKARAALYAGSIAQFGKVQSGGLLGIESSLAKDYYQKCYDACKQITNWGEYSLYDSDANKTQNFKNVFLKKNNSEDIMVIQHDATQRTTSGGNGWIWDFFQCPHPQAWGAGNQNAPYLEMAEAFEHIDGTPGTLDKTTLENRLWSMDELWANKDPRFYATIWTQDTKWQNRKVDFHNGLILPDGTIKGDGAYQGVAAAGDQYIDNYSYGTGFGVMKYLEETHDNTGERATSSTDYILFRYGEVLLNYAEAAFELGKTTDALDAINKIRSRAGIAALSTVNREQIRHERKVELAFEGHRYWDLRRWRIAKDVIPVNRSGLRYILDYNTRKYQVKVLENYDGVTPPVFENRNYYFPITPSRISNNKNLVENPEY